MQIEVLEAATALAERVAQDFLAKMAELQSAGSTPHVALTGGTIADAIHREIARQAPSSGVDFSRIVYWFGDARFVEPDSDDRNAKQAQEAMLDAVGATQVSSSRATLAGSGTRCGWAANWSRTMRNTTMAERPYSRPQSCATKGSAFSTCVAWVSAAMAEYNVCSQTSSGKRL